VLFTHAPPPPRSQSQGLDDEDGDEIGKEGVGGQRDNSGNGHGKGNGNGNGGGGGGRRSMGGGRGDQGGTRRGIGLEADRLLCLTMHDPVEYLPPTGRLYRRRHRWAFFRSCLTVIALAALLAAVCAALWVVPSYKMPRAKEWFRFEEAMKRERLREVLRAEGLLGAEGAENNGTEVGNGGEL